MRSDRTALWGIDRRRPFTEETQEHPYHRPETKGYLIMNVSAIELVYGIAIGAVMLAAVARCVWLLVGVIRILRRQRHSATTRWGWVEVCTFLELVIFFVVTWLHGSRLLVRSDLSLTSLVGPVTGALPALAGLLISFWSFHSYPNARPGHYIEHEHQVITTGAYSLVRHPMYLGVFLIWFGLAIGFVSIVSLLITVFYVIPIYVLYMRSEEAMMVSELGEAYEAYRRRVGMIIPRFR